MSYNNYLDADAAWNCVSEFKNPTCVIVKHTNPCGVASRDDVLQAYRLAVKADPVSAFGGIVAFNVEVDEVSCWRFSKAIFDIFDEFSFREYSLNNVQVF